MDSENPYASPHYVAATERASPARESTSALPQDLWRSGRKLIVASDTSLPEVCPICGSAADGPMRVLKAFWKNPWVSVPIALVAVLLYVSRFTWWFKAPAFLVLFAVEWFLAKRVGKHGLIYYRFCARHERRRANTPWYATICGVTVVAIMAGVFLFSQWRANGAGTTILPYVLIGLVGGLLTLCIATRATPRFQIHKIRGRNIWLSGVNRRLLDLVPEASAAQLAKLLEERP